MKHLLKMSDLSPAELHHILDVAEELKAEQKAGTTPALLKGRSVALMFSKNSTRTRTSFEVGVYQLGGLGNYMNAATELQSGRGEPPSDASLPTQRIVFSTPFFTIPSPPINCCPFLYIK